MTLYNLRVTKFLGNVGTLKKNKRFKKKSEYYKLFTCRFYCRIVILLV